MSLRCELAAPLIANSAVEEKEVARPFRRHAASCLKCQARRSAMVKTARELASLAEERHAAPRDLEWRVMASLDGDLAVARSIRKPLAWAAAGLSMGVAFLIWRIRPQA